MLKEHSHHRDIYKIEQAIDFHTDKRGVEAIFVCFLSHLSHLKINVQHTIFVFSKFDH
jgi:hypothetical protein